MFNGHKKPIKAFKAESAETKDADVKSFADKSIPVLEEHLKLITAIKKSQSSVHWEIPPRSNAVWVAPVCQPQDNGYRFTEGYWK
jgi:hypothetical protein